MERLRPQKQKPIKSSGIIFCTKGKTVNDKKNIKQKRFKIAVGIAFVLCATATALVFIAHRFDHRPFSPETCMASIPKNVEGLEIVQGPRTKESIIEDMVPIYCNAQVLFRKMNAEQKTVNSGKVVFKTLVEYTGEVVGVEIDETTIKSEEFLRKVTDFILRTDFVSWARDDTDTLFVYPIVFGDED